MPMPLILPVLSSINDLPSDLEICDEDGCAFVHAPFGRSADGQWETYIDVGLTPHSTTPIADFRDFEHYEFGYEITTVNTAGKPPEVYSTMDRNLARDWLPGGCQPLVLDVVSHCCRRLLSEIQPGYVWRVTAMANAQGRALDKHTLVTNVMLQEGYSVLRAGTDYMNRKFWLMGRNGFDVSYLL